MVNLDYLYNPAAARDAFKKNYFVDKKLGFRVIEKGTVLPHKDVMVNGKWTWGAGGIIDKNSKFIKESFAVNDRGESYTPPTHTHTRINSTRF